MPKAVARQTDQSVNGLFRALGVDPRKLPRTRPLYRRLVSLLEAASRAAPSPPAGSCRPSAISPRRLHISRATVVSAYRDLEARGLVRGYVGRGTFVSATPDTASAPFAWRGKIAAAALQATETTVRDLVRAAADPALISVAAGVPALDCFPTEAFQRAMARVLADPGRRRVASWADRRAAAFRAALAHRFGGEPEHILVLAGAQQGLDLLARCLIDPGDAVVIDRPGYLGAIQTFRTAGARLVGWDVTRADIDELEELLLRYRPKLIYTNPTIRTRPASTCRSARAARCWSSPSRYRVPIVEDDTYRDLALQRPAAAIAVRARRRACGRDPINSFSKMLAPGLRLGWIGAVRPIVEQLALIKQQIDPHTQNLSQLVVGELIDRACSIATWRR